MVSFMKDKWVSLMLTSICNSNCKHCYINFSGYIPYAQAVLMKESLSKIYNVEVNGAEILTNKEYIKLFTDCGRDSLMTNGKALIENEDLLSYLKENGVDTISLSYHYGVHDDLCQVKTTQLDGLIEKIKDNFRVNIMVTLNSDNYFLLDEMCLFFVKKGVHSIMFTNYLCQGKKCYPEKVLSKEQVQWVLDKIHYLRTQYSKEQLTIKRSGCFGRDVKRNGKFDCSAGIDDFVITPDMKVYPCIFLCDERFLMGKYANGKIIFVKNAEISHSQSECLALKKLNNIDLE